jgi:hypothetical protein
MFFQAGVIGLFSLVAPLKIGENKDGSTITFRFAMKWLV